MPASVHLLMILAWIVFEDLSGGFVFMVLFLPLSLLTSLSP